MYTVALVHVPHEHGACESLLTSFNIFIPQFKSFLSTDNMCPLARVFKVYVKGGDGVNG